MSKRFLLLGLFFLCAWMPFALAAGASRGERVGKSVRAESGRITLCVAYWTQPAGEAPRFFIKSGRDYKFLSIYEMSFGMPLTYHGRLPIPVFRKATEQEIVARKANPEIKKGDIEYIQAFSIDVPKGMSNIGVILTPGDLTKTKPIIFNLKDTDFPNGSTRIINLSRVPLAMQFGAERFLLQPGINRAYRTKPLETPREVIEFKIALNEGNEWKVAYSSAAVFRNTLRYILFIMPRTTDTATQGVFEMRRMMIVKAPELAQGTPAGTSKKSGTSPKTVPEKRPPAR